MAEVVKDPFVFHQAGGESEVGFPILDAELAGLVGALEFPGDAETAEHGFEDVGNGLLLEDAALGGPGEGPEGGHDVEGVGGGVVAAHPPGYGVDEALEKTRGLRGGEEANRDADRLSEEF
jgi:hypothetical protein